MNFLKTYYLKYRSEIWIVLIAVISRIPQLVSDKLILDGDECVVATMAKHLMQGSDFSLFFWGQSYGFSFVETVSIIPFYVLLGYSTLAVKLAMLSLWIAGTIYLYKAIQKLPGNNDRLTFILILILILSPAWGIWSMKARGGYLTAYTLSSLALYIIFRREEVSRSTAIICGILTMLVYESQMLWLTGLLPLVLFQLIRSKGIMNFIFFAMSVMAGVIFFHYYKLQLSNYYQMHIFYPDTMIDKLQRIPKYLYVSQHGRYFFGYLNSPNLFNAAFAIAAVIIMILLPMAGLYYLVKRQRNALLFILSTIFVPVLLVATFFTTDIQPRFLLPMTGYALIAIKLLNNIAPGVLLKIKLSVYGFLGCGIVSMITLYNFYFLDSTIASLDLLINKLKSEGVYYVFCTDGMLEWQINFYSDEKVIARSRWLLGRYPPFNDRVDEALDNGAPVAVMGYKDVYDGMRLSDVKFIGPYFYSINPSKSTLGDGFLFR